MTVIDPTHDSGDCLFAFNLGVFSNELLWNLDQAVLAGSKRHREDALGLVQRLQAIGSKYTGMRTDAPLQLVLNEIREELPENIPESRAEWLDDNSSRYRDPADERSDGEWLYDQFGLGRIRKKLRQVIIDATLATPLQRLSCELGMLIDSGRHRPDTGAHIYRFNPWLLGPMPAVPTPKSDPKNDTVLEDQSSTVSTDAYEQQPLFRTFEPGELPPRPGWWQELTHLCEELHVPCSPEPPDLSTTTGIIDTVELLIEKARANLAELQSDLRPLRREIPDQTGADVVVNQPVIAPRVTQAGVVSSTTPGPRGTPETLGKSDSPHRFEGSTNSNSSDAMPTEIIGKWKFYDAEVQFADLPKLLISQPYRGVLTCLLKCKDYRNWKLLRDAGWSEEDDANRKNIVEAVSRLRDKLKKYLEPALGDQLPENPILNRLSGDDLRYRIDDLLR